MELLTKKNKTMKKIILLILITCALTSFQNYEIDEFSLIGKWKGEADNEVGYIVFQEDGYAYLEFQGQIIGGKEFVIKGEKGSMYYEVDYDKTPITVDLIVKKIESGKTKKLLFIAQIVSENQIKMQLDFSGVRPTEFDDANSLIFNRVE